MPRIDNSKLNLNPNPKILKKIKEISIRLTMATLISDKEKTKMVDGINHIQHSLHGVSAPPLTKAKINYTLQEIETRLNRFDEIQLQTLLTEELRELLSKMETHQEVIKKDFGEKHPFNDHIKKISQTVLYMLEHVKLNQSNLVEVYDFLQTLKPVINIFDLKILEAKGHLVLDDSTKTANVKNKDLNTLISQISESDITKIKETYNLDETLRNLSESIHNYNINESKAIIEEIMSQAISILYPKQNK